MYTVTPGHNGKLCFLSAGDAAAVKSVLGGMLQCKFRVYSNELFVLKEMCFVLTKWCFVKKKISK